jgi:NAD(P)H-hydrate epimerase
MPSGSVLTPHPGELRRLVGEWTSEREKLVKASALARETRSTVVVKGAHSVICTPGGRFFFNSTGNPGMAKGGSGDVLTGLIAGLVARGYSGEDASVTGVYIHGLAGDKAAERHGQEAMNSADLIDYLSE